MRSAYYILDGKTPVPVDDVLVWARWFEGDRTADHRVVARDDIGTVLVSTVFLGIDHAWFDGPPVLFETLVFGWSGEMRRYATWEEAEVGHAEVVADVRAALAAIIHQAQEAEHCRQGGAP